MSLITYLTKIHFSVGIIDEALPHELANLNISNVLIVTDRGLVEAGLVERICDVIPARISVSIYDGTPENPTESACSDAAHIFQQNQCDGIIALGGGSCIDLAKAMAVLATHDKPLSQYAAVEGGVTRIKDILPPLIAIPTTAGTGSEVGRGAIIVFDDGRKLGLISPYLIPSVAICDPALTLGLPAGLTAGTGMDALTHCVETYIATAYNPPADGIALDGLGRAAGNILAAVENGKNIEARREMMAAAMNGALAFQKGLGGVHAISHALGGLAGYRLHHGTLNAILLPHILAFNAPAVEPRYGALKHAMGLADNADLPNEIINLTKRIGLPTKLSEMGIDDAAITKAAPLAERDHTNATNPRKATATDYAEIMRAAL